MKTSKNRHDGGAYRRMKTMISAHAKQGKDRSKAGKEKVLDMFESGFSCIEISEKLNISKHTVYHWCGAGY